MERLTVLPGALQTLAITIRRANELLGLIANTPYPGDGQRYREEQTAIAYAMMHRIRHGGRRHPPRLHRNGTAGN